MAWDLPDAWKLFRSHRLIWQQLADGSTWLGFKLIERSVDSAPAATGLASEDADEEDVIAPSLVHAAAAKWAADHPELASTKKGGRAWEQLIPVLQSTRDPKLTLIPGKFLELLQQWQGPESDFESALISRLRAERRLHAQAFSDGGYDDFWAWESWFIDARTKDIRKCQSRESRPFASFKGTLREEGSVRAPGAPPLCGREGGGGRARSQGGGEGGESGPPGPRFNPRDSGGEALLTQTPSPTELVDEVVTRSPDEPSTERERGMGVQCLSAPTAKAVTGGVGRRGG